MLAAQPESLDQIVDVGQMVMDLAAAERDPLTARHASEQFQQASIARAIDPGRPRDGHLHTGTCGRLAGNALRFELGLLIDVAGLERRIFAGGRTFDVAVDADRAAVNHSSNPAAGRCFDQRADGCGVDRAVGFGRQAGLTVDRRDVVNDVDPGRRLGQRLRIANVTRHDLDGGV
jgi:hypothetical protein